MRADLPCAKSPRRWASRQLTSAVRSKLTARQRRWRPSAEREDRCQGGAEERRTVPPAAEAGMRAYLPLPKLTDEEASNLPYSRNSDSFFCADIGLRISIFDRAGSRYLWPAIS